MPLINHYLTKEKPMAFEHTSVLLKEAIDSLRIDPEGIYVDGTLGGGGHSEAILRQLTTGKLVGIDQDTDALKAASERLACFGERFVPVHSNFSRIPAVLDELNIEAVDGIVLDLGVSSYQLDTGDRGFSYMQEGPLDMRMNREQELNARIVVNEYSEAELTRIIKDYSEERWAKRIAQFIVSARGTQPIETTEELVRIIKQAIPSGARQDGPHPAKRTFQAIRIEVNNELGILEETIKSASPRLKDKGRFSIITFHSLEDRIIKQTFRALSVSCICPPELPICVCGTVPLLKVITRKALEPSAEELALNPRARSARLRVAERIG